MPATLQVETDGICFQRFKVSLKEDRKYLQNKCPGQINMPPASFCNMCCRKDDVCVNLQNNHTTVLTVSDITRLPSWHIRQILASVCSRCIVYISAITESSSKLRLRCEQAMYSQNIVLAPPTPDTSPNNFLQESKSLLDDKPGNSNSEQLNFYGTGFCNDIPNQMSLPIVSSISHNSSVLSSTLETSAFDNVSRSSSPCNTGQNSMLRIHYEEPVSPLNTESGGGSKNKKRSYQRVQVIPVQMICTHCNRAYWRKDFYRKHIRRCSAKVRYARSMVSQRSRSRFELDTISVISEGHEQITTPQQRKSRIFRCSNCTFSADKLGELRQHKRSHMPHHACDICGGEFTSQNEYDFHRAECIAKLEVYEKTVSAARQEVGDMPMRRKTRSYSRAQSVAPSVAPSVKSAKKVSTQKAKTPAKVSANKKVLNSNYNEDEKSNITNYTKRRKSLYEGNDDDDISLADTLYSKRMSLTNHWVEEHSLSSHSHTSQAETHINENLAFPTLKECDLYLLERLKSEVKLNIITCYVPNCKFAFATLEEMMEHDYVDHYRKPWYDCHKCGHCFTSKVFLDYHLDLQNRGRYVCYICGCNFGYQNQLDWHLIQHKNKANKGGEKYICHYCDLKFLDEDKLLNHCYNESHHWSQKREIIQIDHTMTISNNVEENKKTENNQTVTILKMVLKKLPTKRSTPMEKYRFHLRPYLRIPKRIGQVTFPYPNNPNCVGCL